jgi:outer membrane protein
LNRITTTCIVILATAVVGRTLAAQTSAPPATTLTLESALSRALEVNADVEQSRQNVALASAQRDQLVAAVMPKITLTGNLTRNSIQQSFGSGDNEITILPRNNWDYRVVLSQPVYAGRREFRAYSQAKLGIENARQGERGTEDAVLLRVASNYLAVINADRRVDVENENIALAQKRLDQAQAFFDAGEVTKVDVLRAQTSMKAAERLLTVAQQEREHAVAQLRTDLDLDGPISVSAPDHALPSLPPEETLVARATDSRPDIDVAENNVRIAGLEVLKQHGFWLPTVTFDGGFISQKTPFPANEYTYGALRFSIPLFQSGDVIARVAGAKTQEKQAESRLQQAKLIAREDVRRALADLESADKGLQLAKEQLAAAQAEYDQSFDLYRAEEATSLDLAASETSLADARRAVSEETLNHDLAELRVWYAAGAIKEALLAVSH